MSDESPSLSPYTTGTQWDITLHSLQITVTVDIETTFEPTKSQVAVVRLPSVQALTVGWPEVVILKLYDHRFLNDRKRHPWSADTEAAATARWSNLKHASAEEQAEWAEKDSDEYTEADWERHFAELCTERFTAEVEAYRRLDAHQGHSVPRFHGIFTLSSTASTWAPVNGLALERIVGENLGDSPQLSPPDQRLVSRLLLSAVADFHRSGVVHGDIRSGNIMISRYNPTSPDPHLTRVRPVIIDFGFSTLRQAEDDDAKWAEAIKWEDEVEGLKRVLNRRGLRLLSPVRPPSPQQGPTSMMHFRSTVQKMPQQWRDRWYNAPELAEDGELQWRLRPEVAEWLAGRVQSDDAACKPRPGSPDYVSEVTAHASESL